MTTLNAKANNAYRELRSEYVREHPDGLWPGYSHERDAFEDGWETGYKAAAAEMLQHLRALRADAITAERQNAYDRAIEAVQGLS